MKKMKTNKLFLSIAMFAALVFTSCEEQENVKFDSTDLSNTIIELQGTSESLPVKENEASSVTVTVGVSTSSSQDRTISVEIDNSSTATAAQYTLTDIVVPAGEYLGTGTITGDFNALPAVGETTLVLKITGISGSETLIGNDTYTLSLARFCPFDINNFIGTYTATQGANSYDVVATAGPEANTLVLSNIENRGAAIDIIIELTPDVYTAKIRADLDALIYVNGTFGDVDPSNPDPNPSVFNQCSASMSLEYRACIPDGRCFGNRVITFVKQ